LEFSHSVGALVTVVEPSGLVVDKKCEIHAIESKLRIVQHLKGFLFRGFLKGCYLSKHPPQQIDLSTRIRVQKAKNDNKTIDIFGSIQYDVNQRYNQPTPKGMLCLKGIDGDLGLYANKGYLSITACLPNTDAFED
jgi:hypothetical protein